MLEKLPASSPHERTLVDPETIIELKEELEAEAQAHIAALEAFIKEIPITSQAQADHAIAILEAFKIAVQEQLDNFDRGVKLVH